MRTSPRALGRANTRSPAMWLSRACALVTRLAYDGPSDAGLPEKLQAVTEHVQAILQTLGLAKQAEVAAAAQQHAFNHPANSLTAEAAVAANAPYSAFAATAGSTPN